jgi:hypothetical protein
VTVAMTEVTAALLNATVAMTKDRRHQLSGTAVRRGER